MPIKFSLFDFDLTLYNGNSAIDFWFFMITKKWSIILYFPCQIFFGLLYIFRIISAEKFKEKILIFLKPYSKEIIKKYCQEFWQENINKINPRVKECLEKDIQEGLIVVCISASYDFMLVDAIEELKINKLIATQYDLNKRKVIGENCRGENKVIMFKEWLRGNNIIDYSVKNAYSDSKVDLPMLKIAERRYFVRKQKIEKIK